MPSPSTVLTFVLTFIVGFYVLSAAYEPLEDAGLTLQNQLGAEITGEALGTCSATGDCQFYTDYTPVKSGSWTVYANGTPHTSWVNATVAVTLSTGLVNITATGDNPTTANAEITIDYQRQPQVEQVESISSIPSLAVMLFVLLVILGYIMLAARGV